MHTVSKHRNYLHVYRREGPSIANTVGLSGTKLLEVMPVSIVCNLNEFKWNHLSSSDDNPLCLIWLVWQLYLILTMMSLIVWII
jgi:hypothetical protein